MSGWAHGREGTIATIKPVVSALAVLLMTHLANFPYAMPHDAPPDCLDLETEDLVRACVGTDRAATAISTTAMSGHDNIADLASQVQRALESVPNAVCELKIYPSGSAMICQ